MEPLYAVNVMYMLCMHGVHVVHMLCTCKYLRIMHACRVYVAGCMFNISYGPYKQAQNSLLHSTCRQHVTCM